MGLLVIISLIFSVITTLLPIYGIKIKSIRDNCANIVCGKRLMLAVAKGLVEPVLQELEMI